MLFITVTVLHVIAASILCLFILLHAGRGGGLSDMFGGGMSLGGSTVAEKNLDRFTIFAAAMFTVTTISLGFMIKQRDANPITTPPGSEVNIGEDGIPPIPGDIPPPDGEGAGIETGGGGAETGGGTNTGGGAGTDAETE